MKYKELLKFRHNVTSQYGEDGIIAYLTDLMEEDVSKVCCEVGAGDGMTFSNSYQLWKEKGWRALLIEGAEDRYSQLIERCQDIQGVHPVQKLISSKGNNSIEAIAKDEGVDLDAGLLVIDIDSFDSYVFANIGEMKPAICVVEYNNNIPPWIDYQDPEGEVFLRHSLKALVGIGEQLGYVFVVCTITNGIFVRHDLARKYELEATPPEEAYLYEEQANNKSIWGTTISAQLVTSYPVFIKEPKLIDRLYFRLRARMRALAGAEPYRKPSSAAKERVVQAGLFL